MMRLLDWRERTSNILPVRYVFDWEMSTSHKRQEISRILDLISKPQNEQVARMLGLEPRRYSFEHKEGFKPLQAADVLAWQMRSHMQKIWPLGHDDLSLCHKGFALLRENHDLDLGFFTAEQIEKVVQKNEEIEKQVGLPTLYPHRV